MNTVKNFTSFRDVEINIVLDGNRKKMSFQQIEDLLIEKGVPTKYRMGNKFGGLSGSHSVETFANHFTLLFYTNYSEQTFKLNIDFMGVTFWEVPSLTKQDLFLINNPL
jgi:hypothetical protein